MEFKLLALLANGKSPYLKNLRPDVLYRFTDDYEFTGYEEHLPDFRRISAIADKASFPTNLHDIELANGEWLKVHISAILGKNGSGKSSLLEMLYLLVFCLAEKRRFFNLRGNAKTRISRGENEEFLMQYSREIDEILETAKISLFYLLDGKYYVLSNSGKKLQLYELKGQKWMPSGYKSQIAFYTICINYSLYGLNSRGAYFWLDPLFHKNDGYRTPLVLNPFRNSGVIDVNIEAHLAQTRVLSNLTDDIFQAGQLIGDKEIDHIDFTVVPSRIGRVNITDIGLIYRDTLSLTKVDLIGVLEDFIKAYLKHIKMDFKPWRDYLEKELQPSDAAKRQLTYRFEKEKSADFNLIRRLLVKYCITKIAKICTNYEHYRVLTDFHRLKDEGPGFWLIKDRKRLVQRLLGDDSHVTLKLKQAVNAFGADYFGKRKWKIVRDPDSIDQLNYRCTIDQKSFSEMVNTAYERSRQKKKRLAQFIPTAFYVPSIMLRHDKDASEFQQLSSGEQQLLHSIHAVIYHLLNIETLHGATRYRAVNIILDEIELYYHPDYQRVFILTLLQTLSRLHLTTIKAVNVIFSTHSPFILSDIPSVSVLKLKGGKPEKADDTPITFGGNIHEMLADVFFLDRELIGAFAKMKIEQCIARLENLRLLIGVVPPQLQNKPADIELAVPEKKTETYLDAVKDEDKNKDLYRFIQTIGEPVIRYKLLEMYDEVFPAVDRNREAARRAIRRLLEENDLTKDDI